MDRIGIKTYDYGRQTERRRQARRRARRRAFFLAAAELAAGICMTMAVMAMVIPEKRELGMAGTEQGRIKQEITELGRIKQEMTERERIERQCAGRGGTEILSRILEDTHVLQSSIKGQGNPFFLLAIRILYIQVPLSLRWMQAMAVRMKAPARKA